MRHAIAFYSILGLFLIATSTPMQLAEAGDAEEIRGVLKAIQRAAASDDAGAFETALGAAVLRSVPRDRLVEHLAHLRTGILDTKIGTVKIEKKKAVADLVRTGRVAGTSQVTLMRDGGSWRLSSPYLYPVKGASIEKRRGRKPAAIRLKLRKSNGAYGSSAYSFRYVTGDAKAARNRMDIWVCHNDDIHARGLGRIADLGETKLEKPHGIPLGATWGGTAQIQVGHTYVVLCRDERDRDFYVKLRVKSFTRNAVDLEWTLLTGGFGAPANINKAVTFESRDGADGTDGLCGKNG